MNMARSILIIVLSFTFLSSGCGQAVEVGGSGNRPSSPSVVPSSTAPPERNLAAKYRIRFDGLGPVKVGMKPGDASKAFGEDLTENRLDDESDCYYLDMNADDPESAPSFMVNAGTIARVDVSTPDYLTEAGAKVGDTEERIKELYGPGVEVSPHEYVDGHYLTVTSKDGKYAIVFETDGEKVTYIRAGRPPEVGYIEGCA